MFTPKDKSFDKDALQTPPYIINWLRTMYDFDVDLAASDDHHWCDTYFTKSSSGLDKSWIEHGSTGFCNPPYSKIDPWINKAIEEADHGFTTVFLIPDVNGEARFEAILSQASVFVHMVGRVDFIRPDSNTPYRGNNRGSCIVEFSPKFYPRPAHHTFINTKWIKENFEGYTA